MFLLFETTDWMYLNNTFSIPASSERKAACNCSRISTETFFCSFAQTRLAFTGSLITLWVSPKRECLAWPIRWMSGS